MKILSIIGSPHGEKGNTGLLLSEVLKGAKDLGATCETISLHGDKLKLCSGCNLCHVRGYCHLKDDFELIKKKLLEVDALILATPNYIFHVSAQLKVFIDRCACLIHTMALEGKYGASIVTSGGGDEKPIIDYLNHFLTISGVMPVDSMWANMGLTNESKLSEELCLEAHSVGKNLVEAWNNKIKLNIVTKIQDEHRIRMLKLINYYNSTLSDNPLISQKLRVEKINISLNI